MEAERYVMGYLGPGELGQVRRVEDQQERALRLGVEDDRQQDAGVLRLGSRFGDEHRLARVAVRLEPGLARALLEVDGDDAVEEAAGTLRVRPRTPRVAVGTLVAAAVVDPRQVEAVGNELLAGDGAARRVDREAGERGLGDVTALAQ